MNRISRMLTITGLGLFAGITIGAAPAMAATNTGQAAAKPSTTNATVKPGERVAGYYDSRDECRMAGRIGDRLGRWDDWDCYPVIGGGWHDGDWVLVVDYNWDGGFPFDHGHHIGFPFPFHHGPFHHGGPHGGGVMHHNGGTHDTTHNNVGMPTARPARS